MRKKHQVHMLPTDKRSDTPYIQYCSAGFGTFVMSNTGLWNKKHYVPQHLYFTSDEEIEEPCWIIASTPEGSKLLQIDNISNNPKYFDMKGRYALSRDICRKIVAATNPDLWKKYIQTEEGEFALLGGIPKIGLDFVKRYIEKKGNIKEVDLETDFIHNGGGEGHDILKLRSDGTVIIHPVKEKMYTRDEVLDMLRQWDRYRSNILDTPILRKQWFDKNYPNI